MLENKNRIVIFIILLFISSCQKVDILDPIVFDNDQFAKISINAEKKNTIILYEPKLTYDLPVIGIIFLALMENDYKWRQHLCQALALSLSLIPLNNHIIRKDYVLPITNLVLSFHLFSDL